MNIKSFCEMSNKSKKITLVIEDNKLDDLLDAYKNNEYIPVGIINNVLLKIFKTCEILHSYNENHKIIKIQVNDLLEAPVSNWVYNRPPDLVKCNDMARYIYSSKKPSDTMLYVSFNNKQRSIEIIDGIHRYTSLKIIYENNNTPIDILTPGDFGNNKDAIWLYESYIIVNIRFNATEGELIELFKTLNKSTPVPELYIKDFIKEKREIIENIANNWQIKYKGHFSQNNKPNKPNINRNQFVELLDKAYDKYKINETNKHMLDQILDRLNTNISYNIPKKISEQIKDKCISSGCWLFIYTLDKLMTMI